MGNETTNTTQTQHQQQTHQMTLKPSGNTKHHIREMKQPSSSRNGK